MKRHLLILISLIIGLTSSAYGSLQPQQQPDSIRFSLLTCAAGGEIYSLFGHTAIRYENYTQGIDAVYNYGMFNFNTPNFALRFALGETDYLLGVTSFKRFSAEYFFSGRDVWQQTLNLTYPEKMRLLTLLNENYRPENRMYRYNFFYDNCATRPRDRIEAAIDGTIRYANDMNDRQTGITFRDQLRKYCQGHPWSGLGIDLCMGSPADLPISRHEMMFVPFDLQSFFRQAQIVDTLGQCRPLVSAEERLIVTGTQPSDYYETGITPQQSAWLLLLIVAGISAWGIRCRKTYWWVDLPLFAAAGIAGCILAFLAGFSQHPAVSPNYLLFLFHPLHILCLPWMLYAVKQGRKSTYMMINAVVLTLFITLSPLIPQRFDPTVLPLALCLLTRSVSNLVISKNSN